MDLIFNDFTTKFNEKFTFRTYDGNVGHIEKPILKLDRTEYVIAVLKFLEQNEYIYT